jgi:hypothetical protein
MLIGIGLTWRRRSTIAPPGNPTTTKSRILVMKGERPRRMAEPDPACLSADGITPAETDAGAPDRPINAGWTHARRGADDARTGAPDCLRATGPTEAVNAA